MRSFAFSLALAVVVTGCGPLNPLFAGGPYRGRVIDSETKQPIVGAVVLVYWRRLAPGIGHGPAESFLDAEEVLTDSNGEFVVGTSPPGTLTPGTWVSDPHITIFKPGYGFFPRYHTSPPPPPTRWKGLLEMMERETVVIELPRLKTREERLKVVEFVNPLIVPKEKMPNFVRLLNNERKSLHLPILYNQK